MQSKAAEQLQKWVMGALMFSVQLILKESRQSLVFETRHSTFLFHTLLFVT